MNRYLLSYTIGVTVETDAPDLAVRAISIAIDDSTVLPLLAAQVAHNCEQHFPAVRYRSLVGGLAGAPVALPAPYSLPFDEDQS